MLQYYCVLVFQLIKLNSPDLVLFVGEALVGNEAVDQLKKFNQALADFSMAENPRLIDGILLTKFDTIDDKVRSHFALLFVHYGLKRQHHGRSSKFLRKLC